MENDQPLALRRYRVLPIASPVRGSPVATYRVTPRVRRRASTTHFPDAPTFAVCGRDGEEEQARLRQGLEI